MLVCSPIEIVDHRGDCRWKRSLNRVKGRKLLVTHVDCVHHRRVDMVNLALALRILAKPVLHPDGRDDARVVCCIDVGESGILKLAEL